MRFTGFYVPVGGLWALSTVNIKDIRDRNRFMRHIWSMSEWSLVCGTHNLLKSEKPKGLLELKKGDVCFCAVFCLHL